MKSKKGILSIIILSIILIMFPTNAFAWLGKEIYYACNPINMHISGLMKIIAVIIAITYITIALGHMRHSTEEKNKKNKNHLKWMLIVIIQVTILLLGSLWVKQVGIEPYWYPSGERYQFNEIDGYISNGIRITALVSIIVYIITSIIYFFKSKKENNEKIINLAKWQMITIMIVTVLLVIATKW